ncbi:MAG UNVERIFIED_CONTAM: hypothetical protein LVR18_12785 [Planctomycetaceae bacterium]
MERSVTAVPAGEAETFMQDLGRSGLIVSQLKTRLQRGVQVFDIKAVRNSDEAAWMVHINLSAAEFREKRELYEKDGYELTQEQGILSGRQRRWLGVWVQRKTLPARMQLPPGPPPVSGTLAPSLNL